MESIVEILRIPLGYVMRLCYLLTQNYLFALLLFALVMQILLLPLGIKQQKNMVRQASLRPKEQAIRKKYAGRNDKATQQKMQDEILALYQSENFNPMGGCLPLLIQMPILFALYQVIIRPLRYLVGLPSAVVTLIKERAVELGATIGDRMPEIDISNAIHQIGIDKFADIEGAEKLAENLVPKMTIFGGFDMAQTPAFTSILILVPILTLVVSVVTQKLTRKFSYNPQEQQQNNISMKIMEYSMPLLSFWITFQVPAAIGVYWIFRNLLQFVQTLVLYKALPYPKFTEEDFKRAEKEANATKKNYKKISNVAVSHSLHHIDDDDDTVVRVEAPKKAEPKQDPKGFGLETASMKEDKKNDKKTEE